MRKMLNHKKVPYKKKTDIIKMKHYPKEDIKTPKHK